MSKPQHMQALDKANSVRTSRATLKRQIKAGEVKLPGLLREGIPDCLGKLSADELFRTVRSLHATRRTRWFQKAFLNPSQRAANITVRQCNLLAAELENWERDKELKQERREKREELLREAA